MNILNAAQTGKQSTQDTKESNEKEINASTPLSDLADMLAGESRRQRQQAASALAEISKEDAESLAPYVNVFIAALKQPEAQTRWESLEVLALLVPFEGRACEKALAGADAALFDEDSGLLRLSAMRFLCKYGATTPGRSEKTWPLIDEGIQCYHGDLEFQDMLLAVIDFSAGRLSPKVKSELAARMRFDAENGKGPLQRRARQILDNVS